LTPIDTLHGHKIKENTVYYKNNRAKTLEDVLGIIQKSNLPPFHHRDMTSAIKRICEMAGVAPPLVPAEAPALRAMIAKIRPAVEATRYQGERSATNYDFVDAVARKNVELTMAAIRRSSTVLAALGTSGAVKIVGAMYDLETGLVEFFG
jgi:hypothetical protein